jgi:hypothetical protein
VARTDRAVQAHLGGEAVTYASLLGTFPVTGMFDENYVLIEGAAHAGVEQIGPSVWLRLEDLPVHPDQDEPVLTIKGQAYVVRERQVDKGGGSIRLLLHLAPEPELKSGSAASLGFAFGDRRVHGGSPMRDMRTYLNQLGVLG